MDSKPLLQVKNLKTYFYLNEGIVRAVDDINLEIPVGSCVGIVGESGCGKSVLSLSIMRLIQSPPGKIISGQILFNGEDLLKKKESEMRNIRGSTISMIFQEPMTSLNPVFTVGNQVVEAVLRHNKISIQKAYEQSLEMFKQVGIPIPEKRLNEYPYQLSGGMLQRVMIAMMLICKPKLLIADEPTTALDVTIQAQILEILKEIIHKTTTSIIFITHDLGVIADMCDQIIVMYAGKIVEKSNVYDLFKQPLHPYTEGLLNSIPTIEDNKEKMLKVIKGIVPNPLKLPTGCRFNNRCDYAESVCREEEPRLIQMNQGRYVSCWKYDNDKRGLA